MELVEFGSKRDDYVIATYRYLRISLLVLISALFISLIVEIASGAGWLGSISDYYHTPVRPVFVGMLMTIGVSMIAIQGRHSFEDTMLNIAGALAFVVALVPNSGPSYCNEDGGDTWNCVPRDVDANLQAAAGDLRGVDLPEGISLLQAVEYAESVEVIGKVELLRNNMPALFIALALALLLVMLFSKLNVIDEPGVAPGTIWSAGVIVAFVLGGAAWYGLGNESFIANSHGVAAVAMFGFIGLAVLGNTGLLRTSWEDRVGITPDRLPSAGFQTFYRCALALMVLTLVIALVLWRLEERTVVFWLEIGEIACLAVYWTAQTIEGWNDGPTAVAAAQSPDK